MTKTILIDPRADWPAVYIDGGLAFQAPTLAECEAFASIARRADPLARVHITHSLASTRKAA